MRIGFPRAFFAIWLAIAALTTNGFAQQQLGFDVIAATAAGDSTHSAVHVMPDGTVMAGVMAGSMAHAAGDSHATAGHTHKGHADCDICGVVADMAGFTLTTLAILPLPPERHAGFIPATPDTQARTAAAPPYSSRAPPVLMS